VRCRDCGGIGHNYVTHLKTVEKVEKGESLDDFMYSKKRSNKSSGKL
jgi:hypothetical protein